MPASDFLAYICLLFCEFHIFIFLIVHQSLVLNRSKNAGNNGHFDGHLLGNIFEEYNLLSLDQIKNRLQLVLYDRSQAIFRKVAFLQTLFFISTVRSVKHFLYYITVCLLVCKQYLYKIRWNAQEFSKSSPVESRHHRLRLLILIIYLFQLNGWDISDRSRQPSDVEPIQTLQGGGFHGAWTSPQPSPPYRLGLVQNRSQRWPPKIGQLC